MKNNHDMKSSRMILLNPIVHESDLSCYRSLSVATNVWLTGFLSSLNGLGPNLISCGYIPESPWPYGRIFFGSQIANFPSFSSYHVGYLNLPILRFWFRFISLALFLSREISHCRRNNLIPVLSSFTCIDHPFQIFPEILVAQILSFLYRIKYVPIVGDGIPPLFASKYIYLASSALKLLPRTKPSLSFEGGILDLEIQTSDSCYYSESYASRIIIYCGSLGIHGGISQFLSKLRQFNLTGNYSLHIYGPGLSEFESSSLLGDLNVKFFGMVDEETLHRACIKCYAFLNPRPIDFKPNTLNFPSKLLHYLRYCKPILSTKTPGIPSEYDNILDYYTDHSLFSSFTDLLDLTYIDYVQKSRLIRKFASGKTWHNRSSQLQEFLFHSP